MSSKFSRQFEIWWLDRNQAKTFKREASSSLKKVELPRKDSTGRDDISEKDIFPEQRED